jgi:hypothetical protein
MNYETLANRARWFSHNHGAFMANLVVGISLFTDLVQMGMYSSVSLTGFAAAFGITVVFCGSFSEP